MMTMPKVITSEGLNEFVSTGEPTSNIARKQPKGTHANPNKAPPQAAKPVEDTPPPPPPQAETVSTAASSEAPDRDIEQDDDWKKYADLPMPERIKKVVGKKHFEMMTAKEEAAELERLAEQQYNRAIMAEKALREAQAGQAPPPAPPVQPEEKAPDQNDPKYRNDKGEFDWVTYTRDTADYSAKQAVSKFQQDQLKEANEKAAAQAKIAYETRIEEARKIHTDYDQVVPVADIHTHRAVLDYVFFDSKVPGQIAYYLAKNPEFLRQINSMSATAAVAEIGALAKTLEKPATTSSATAPVVKATPRSGGAPPPITPLDTSNSGTVNIDPSKMSFQELRRFERQRAARRH